MDDNTYIGKNTLQYLDGILGKLQVKRIFLVTGTKSFTLNSANEFFHKLSEKYFITRFSEYSKNTSINDVVNGINLYNKINYDVIITLGGGSSIDMGKAIKALHHIKDPGRIENIKPDIIVRNKVKLIAIPTTSGSGSEATHFAVIYFNNIKYSLANQSLKPDYVIIDTDLIRTQSGYQKAVSGMDAFTQATEALWSINSTEESMQYSVLAIQLLWNNLHKMIVDPDDDVILNVARGAYYAGKAINIAKTTAPHALSYSLTILKKIPHGQAVALSFPFFVDLHLKANINNCQDKRGYEWVLAIMEKFAEILEVPKESLVKSVSEFIQKCGLETSFARLNISRDDFKKASGQINLERLGNNPVKINDSIISAIYDFS